MKQDKEFVNVTDDSLARVAYDHYSLWGTRRNKMLSAYYLANVYMNAGNNVEATVLFMEAEQRACQIQDYHYRGFAQQRLAELYANNYDYEEAQTYNRKAIASLTLSGDTLAADVSRIYLARQYCIRDEWDKAERIADSLLQACPSTNSLIHAYASTIKGDVCFAREDWEQASQYYDSLEAQGYQPFVSTLGNKAYIQEKTGFPHRADSLMDLAWRQVASAIDSTIYFSCANDLFLLRNDYPNAYKALETTTSAQNKSVSFLLARSVTHAQKAYYEEHYHLEQTRTRSLALVTSLIILSLGIVIFFILRALHRRKEEIEQEREMVRALKKDMLLLQEEQKSAGVIVNTLLQDKIDRIQKLSGTYFYWADEAVALREVQRGKAMKEEIIAEFRHELRELRDDPHFFSDIEKALDHAYDGVMRRLRQTAAHTPNFHLDDDDYKQLMLFFSNFSTKSISFILDTKDDTVRKRKSRYKKLFIDQGEPFLEFLKYLL